MTHMCLIYLARESGLPWGVPETGSLFWHLWYLLLPSRSLPTLTWDIGWGLGEALLSLAQRWVLGPGLPSAGEQSLKQRGTGKTHGLKWGRGLVLSAWRLGHVCTCPSRSADWQGRLAGPVCVGGSRQQCHVLTPHSQTPSHLVLSVRTTPRTSVKQRG